MFAEIVEPFLTWKLFIFIIIISLLLFHQHFEIVKNCLLSQATGKIKYVLITGCDTGFGYKTALDLNASKVTVFAACLTQDGVQRFKENPTFRGYAIRMDVTNDDDVMKVFQFIENIAGDRGLWSVINNAGVPGYGIIDWLQIEDMKHFMDVNLWGAVLITKTMLPLLKKTKGRVINMTSTAGRVSSFGLAGYSMTKHALEAFSNTLRLEMKPWGITVHTVEPGLFKTPIVLRGREEWEALYNNQSDQMKTDYGNNYIQKVIQMHDGFVDMATTDVKKVIDAINHATLSSNPKRRYIVGYDAWLLTSFMTFLPTFISDYFLQRLANLPYPNAVCEEKKKKKRYHTEQMKIA